jgi:acetyl esterase/lipase
MPDRRDVTGAASTPLPLWAAEDATGADATGADSMPAIPRLTPYLPAGAARGIVIVCPGGGYRMLAPHEGAPIARWLNGLGIAAFVLEYRVAPHRHPTPLGDLQRAIRLVRGRAAAWGLAGQPLGVLGFSAGGHLAASAGVCGGDGDARSADPVARAGCRPDALVLCYPVISFGAARHRGSVENLLGAGATDEQIAALSVETLVTPTTPPTFLWHTAADEKVPVENSLLFASALGRAGVPFALHVYSHGRHGLGLATDDPVVGSWTALCASWLATLGFGSPACGA